jgi:hypothetical protein
MRIGKDRPGLFSLSYRASVWLKLRRTFSEVLFSMDPLISFFVDHSIEGDSRVIMSLTKFVMHATLHLHRLCGFKKYIFFYFIQHSQHTRHYICQI